MPTFKLIISEQETGKSNVYEIKDAPALTLIGLKIGDEIDASVLGIDGKIKITGGSDRAGFPMRSDVKGGVKKYVLLTKGVGFKPKNKGERRRKLVRGNTITEEIYQLNGILIKTVKKEDEVAGDTSTI
ncbi:MAG: 30S ribosomal protein S6e [Candidatus Methylarchaceae archaeon HK02M1]|nr:30S ribosomal protein S6e [Candidatus Methylarchaceae archaeon HK01M]MCP8311973.1 30S ribosomal protein S6e [Candidatus Methylarchaceae archaeon HK02M1]